MGYLTEEQLKDTFREVGSNVLVSDKASIYGGKHISIGNNVRIDDFCILSSGDGWIKIGSNIHIAAGVYIYGAGKVKISDFATISSRTVIYSASDTYDGSCLIGPQIPKKYLKVKKSKIVIGKGAAIATNCTLLPGARMEDFSVLAANSLCNSVLNYATIYAGTPCKPLKERKLDLKRMIDEINSKQR